MSGDAFTAVELNGSHKPMMLGAEESEKTLRLSQYRPNGQGFAPCPTTIGKLPAGVYSIGQREREIFFVPESIITDTLMQFPDTKSDEIVKEIDDFWALRPKFKDFGLTFKRGILMYGPPGSGKTATLAIVMKKMAMRGGIVILCGGNFGAVSSGLEMLREVEPERPCLVIMEDFEEIMAHNSESYILSVLDGESQVDGIVYLATTNYLHRLPARVINRPSRFDKVIKIDMPNAKARRMYIESKVGSRISSAEVTDWVKETDGFSIAHVKEVIISVFCYGVPLGETIMRLRAMQDVKGLRTLMEKEEKDI
jgi:AAA+ superfamily predicted ATPase